MRLDTPLRDEAVRKGSATIIDPDGAPIPGTQTVRRWDPENPGRLKPPQTIRETEIRYGVALRSPRIAWALTHPEPRSASEVPYIRTRADGRFGIRVEIAQPTSPAPVPLCSQGHRMETASKPGRVVYSCPTCGESWGRRI